MATLDDSVTLFNGQSWSHWLDSASQNLSEESMPESPTTGNSTDSMKLRKEDVGLYGLCPARDEFYLVVCECCGQVIKPQALQRHLDSVAEQRHNIVSKKLSPSTSSTSSRSPTKTSSSKSNSSSHNKDHRHSKNAHKPTKRPNNNAPPQLHPKDKPPEVSKCKRTALVKVERMEPGNIKRPPAMLPKASVAPNKETHGSSEVKESVMNSTSRESSSSKARDNMGTSNSIRDSQSSKTRDTSTSNSRESTISGTRDSTASNEKISFTEKHDADIPVRKATPLTKSSISRGKSPIPVTKVTNMEENQTPPTTVVVTTIYPSAPVTTATAAISMATAVITSPRMTVVTTSMAPRMSLSSGITVTSSKTVPLVTAPNLSRDFPKAGKRPAGVIITTSVSAVERLSQSSTSSTPLITTSVVTTKTMTKPILSTQVSSGSTGSRRSTTRKTPLCKDREYDANQHCGVWIGDQQRQCTRSLTCKSHSLSLRRAVTGRVKSFDDLLREHREAKEALLLKTKGEGSTTNSSHSSSTLKTITKASAASTLSKSAPTTPVSSMPIVFKSPVAETKISVPVVNQSPPVIKPHLPAKEKLCLSSSITRQSSLPAFAKTEPICLPESLSYLSSDGEEEDDDSDRTDYPCLSHHPRPAAVNSFGSWRYGAGSYVFNRKEDLCRSAFYAAVERHLHPPPHKKLCVESNLPKESSVLSNVRDPYDFAFGDGTQGNQRRANLACRMVTKTVAKTIKPNVGSSPPASGAKTVLSAVTSPNSMGLTGLEFLESSVSSTTNCIQSPPSVKRKRTGSSPITQSLGGVNNGTGPMLLSTSSVATSLGTNVSCSSPIAITIPASINFNLSSSTLSNINATLATAQGVRNKTTVRDIGKISMDGGGAAQMNGQLINIGSNITEMTHIQLNSLSAKAKHNKGANRVVQGTHVQHMPGKLQLNKSPSARVQNKTLPILSRHQSAPNSLSLTPVISSVGVGGFLHLDTQLSNTVGGSAITLASSATSGGSSDSVSSTQVSPVQLSSPVLLSGSSSPNSPPPNGMLSPASQVGKLGSAGSHGSYLLDDDGMTTNINLALTEQLLGSGISITPENALARSMSAGSHRGSGATQVTLSASAATAQQLAAAALNLTTQPGCLLTSHNSVPQLYATQVLAKTSPATQLGSLQFQARPSMRSVGGPTSKVPMPPLSLTILGPGGSVPTNQRQQSHLVLHAADESHSASNMS